MIQYQLAGSGARCNVAELCRRGVRLRVVGLSFWWKARESGVRVHLMNQHVATTTLRVGRSAVMVALLKCAPRTLEHRCAQPPPHDERRLLQRRTGKQLSRRRLRPLVRCDLDQGSASQSRALQFASSTTVRPQGLAVRQGTTARLWREEPG